MGAWGALDGVGFGGGGNGGGGTFAICGAFTMHPYQHLGQLLVRDGPDEQEEALALEKVVRLQGYWYGSQLSRRKRQDLRAMALGCMRRIKKGYQ